MTAPPYRPHLWVPDWPEGAEICTLCGEYATPENAEASCPETIDDMPEPPRELRMPPPEMPEPPDGWDDEQRRQKAIMPP
jgi:hypothetical protein